MRKFILYTLAFLLVNGCLLLAEEAWNYYSGAYEKKSISPEVHEAIHTAKKSRAAKRLLIGDSVCRQLYWTGRPGADVVSLGCNQAVTMAGHFFLFKDYLAAHPDSLPEQLILSFDASSLGNNLDVYSYHYFLKPFFRRENSGCFNQHLWNRISCIPFYWSCRLPFIRSNGFSVEYEMPQEEYSLASPVTIDYLDSIVTTADRLGIPVVMLSNPIRESRAEWVECQYQGALQRDEFKRLAPLFEGWHQSIVTYPDSCFRDHVHFRQEDIPYDIYQLK